MADDRPRADVEHANGSRPGGGSPSADDLDDRDDVERTIDASEARRRMARAEAIERGPAPDERSADDAEATVATPDELRSVLDELRRAATDGSTGSAVSETRDSRAAPIGGVDSPTDDPAMLDRGVDPEETPPPAGDEPDAAPTVDPPVPPESGGGRWVPPARLADPRPIREESAIVDFRSVRTTGGRSVVAIATIGVLLVLAVVLGFVLLTADDDEPGPPPDPDSSISPTETASVGGEDR